MKSVLFRQVTLAGVLSAACGSWLVVGAQQAAPVPGPPPRVVAPTTSAPRDPAAPPPVRRIPIGTSTLTGTVVDATTGRPLALARVSISGQVVAATRPTIGPGSGTGTGRGVGGGFVALGGTAASAAIQASLVGPVSRQVVTDARGQFTFRALPGGQFSVNVMRDQYLAQNYGQTKPNRPGTPVKVGEGESVSITVRLQKGGVITGTVTGEDGLPAAGARVQAMRFGYQQGIRRLIGTAGATSDDRGVYRLFGLQPGDYVVAVTPSMATIGIIEMAALDSAAFDAALAATLASSPADRPNAVAVAQPIMNQGPSTGYAATYFPAAPSPATATRITVEASNERAGVDVVVLPIRAGNVAGEVVGLSGPDVIAMVTLQPEESAAATTQTMTTQTAPDGTFTVRNVMPGRYTVLAQVTRNNRQGPPVVTPGQGFTAPPQIAPADRLWGRTDVVVEGPATPRVTITLQPPKTVSGSVVVQSDYPAQLAQMRLNVSVTPAPSVVSTPMNGGPPQAVVDADGRFTLAGLLPGRYLFRVGGPVRSILLDGRDLLDFPLVVDDKNIENVVVTLGRPSTTTLSGALTDPQGLDPTLYTVIVASADKQYWMPGGRRIRSARPDADGVYRFVGLPAGAYRLAAVTDVEPGGEYDPEFLAAMASASVPITLTEGGTVTQNLGVAR